jgi:hypothetical protein
MGIKWVDNPPEPRPGRPGVGRPKYYAFAEALKRRPGQWAVLGTASSALAHQIGAGKTVAFQPAGTFEAVSRKEANDRPGRGTIYVRYLGNGTDDE